MPHSNDAPLDSHQLRVFVTLANSGGFTRAGRELHLTQSAVSHSIRALEDATSCRLFDRVGKTAHLTPAGEQLLHHASEILRENSAARAALAHRKLWGKARLRVAVNPVLAESRLAQAIRAFVRQSPGCPVALELACEARAIDLLLANDVDVAFGVPPTRDPRLRTRSILVDELRVAVPAEHPWAKSGRIERDAMAAERWILPPPGDGTRQLIDAYMRREGHPVSSHLDAAGAKLAMEMVRGGVGIAVLAPWSIVGSGTGEGVKWLSPGRRKLRRTWSAMTLRDEEPTLAAEMLAKALGESLLGA